jgi:hypothetical protein
MKAIVRGLVAFVTIAALCGSGCVSRRKYRECQDELAKCKAGSATSASSAGTAAFTVTIDNDAFAQFLPMNNRFWGEPEPAKYYGGFLVQLASMKEASHSYSNVDLTMADGSKTSLGRTDAQWVNIVCEPMPGTPISVTLARLLIPDGQPGTVDRVVHRSILPDTVSLLTIWRAAGPISVQSSPSAAGGSDHGHDQFVFSSPTACGVEVWEKIAQNAPTTTYSPNQVKAVRIHEALESTPHGGVHQPWWFK